MTGISGRRYRHEIPELTEPADRLAAGEGAVAQDLRGPTHRAALGLVRSS